MLHHWYKDLEQRGLSFIEILCTIGIIAILAAIAYPSYIRSKRASNEAATVAALKVIVDAQGEYSDNAFPHTFASSIRQLYTGEGALDVLYLEKIADLKEENLDSGAYKGYIFILEAGAFTDNTYSAWSAEAHPIIYNTTGKPSFYVDERGKLYGRDMKGQRGTRDMPEFR